MKPDVSVVVVSFNTHELLRECLRTVYAQSGIALEVIVVDNASRDGSLEMVQSQFPSVRTIASDRNLGFAAANNAGFAIASGRYVVLLNSDAFLRPGTLARAVALMEAHPNAGLAGGLLVGRDGALQPSARLFPSLLNEILCFTGLSSKFPRSRFFGRTDRTWADPTQAAVTDWVPGAFSIIRRETLEKVGYFDEQFFLYYEEVDLCRRIKAIGYEIAYWPELVVTHIGGESSKTVKRLQLSTNGSQLTLWRMRSELLYYRKHHSSFARWAMFAEGLWHWMRMAKNRLSTGAQALEKAQESSAVLQLWSRAWSETNGGRVSPTRPW